MPPPAAAVLAALHLDAPDFRFHLNDRQWREALDYADRERLTLVFRTAARDSLPAWVRTRLDHDAVRNQVRLANIRQTYSDLSGWLARAGLDFIFLKGLTHRTLCDRVQYDIDLWLPPADAVAAQQLLMRRGYEPLPDTENLPTDHLPALVRKTGWRWRGDFFDPEIPVPIELHTRFWNEDWERFSAPGVDHFPKRRAAAAGLPSLHPADSIAYAALHLLKHVLAGSARIFHAFEIAVMLQVRADDDAFWIQWRELHPPELRKLQAIAFAIAGRWFGGALNGIAENEIGVLPHTLRLWLREFGDSPLTLAFHPNKDHLWLHLALLHSRRDAWNVASRCLFPRRLPSAAADSFVPQSQRRWHDWLRWRFHWMRHVALRLWHHAAAMPAVVRSAWRWWKLLR